MNHLRKRLAGLYTVTTGLILLLVITAFFLSFAAKTRRGQQEQFQVVWSSLCSRLQASSSFSHSYLAQTETDYRMIIHIRENGSPFFYQGSWQSPTNRDVLIERACGQARAEGVFPDRAPVSSSSVTSSLMTVEGDHKDRYYARLFTLSTKNGAKSLCVIAFIPPPWESLGGTLLFLCLLAAAGIGYLWLFSWKFVGWSLKPVEESQNRQARFIAAASHELRSPLAVLRSAVAAISVSPQQKDTLLPLIDSECVRMSRLIDDLLLLASADAKTWSLRTEQIDMDTLLIDLYEVFRPVCAQQNIALYLQLPDEPLPRISGDPDRIRQLLMVLLENAGNYTPAGRSIFIRAFRSPKRHTLTVQVADEGCGVPAESRPYIFDRFYRADSARSDKQHFGLGLSIARELALLHKGTISLSDEPGGGSCFSVELPCIKE